MANISVVRVRTRLTLLLAMLLSPVAASLGSSAPASGSTQFSPAIDLKVLSLSKPLIDEKTPGMERVKYGNEGGEVVRDRHGQYHFFTSEQFGDPYWVANRITHWTSADGDKWVKDASWVKEGNHDYANRRPKSSYFDPRLVYDPESKYWYMFYIAYYCMPDKEYHEAMVKAHPASLYDGGWNRASVYRAKAVKPGLDGLGGPYHDNDADDVAVVKPLDNPPPYEARWVGDTKFGYGAATVTVYQAGHTWYLLYAENMLATSSSVSGTFTRLREGPDNPVTFHRAAMEWNEKNAFDFYLENPIIYKIPSGSTGAGTYVMMVGEYIDHSIGIKDTSFGYATSKDGVHWSEVTPLSVRFADCITADSFLPEGNDEYSIFVTGRNGYERVARIRVKLSLRQQGRAGQQE